MGQFDRNLGVAREYGLNLQASGIPGLVVLSGSGKVKTRDERRFVRQRAHDQAVESGRVPEALAMRWTVLGGLLLLVCGCGRGNAPPPSISFTESGVEVSISVSESQVTAVFRPTRAGFHVYSVDLPEGGVDGLGIPTRLKVRGGLAATGRAGTDKAVRMLDLPSLGVKLPVYPDGPVTASLPVQRSGRSAEVVVSYGACSSGTCLPPVIDHVSRVTPV